MLFDQTLSLLTLSSDEGSDKSRSDLNPDTVVAHRLWYVGRVCTVSQVSDITYMQWH